MKPAAIMRAVLIGGWLAFWIPPISLLHRLRMNRVKRPLLRFTSRVLVWLCGVRVVVGGQLAAQRPLLLVTNHCSYMDVIILGAVCDVRFTPKSEIAKWPVFGTLSRITDSVFIDRKTRRTADNRFSLLAALREGKPVCLFPEGTTGDGRQVLAFRSSYFSLAEEDFGGKELAVQPAAISYRRINNIPVCRADRARLAWYGDMELVPHLLEFLGLGSVTVQVDFLEPVTLSRFSGRKELAEFCRRRIVEKLEES